MGSEKKTNNYWIAYGVCYIDVSTKKHPNTFALIDASDAALVLGYPFGRWGARLCTGKRTTYARRSDNSGMHSAVLGVSDGSPVDHINLDGLDNKRSNLRIATPSQNQANQLPSRGGSSKYKVVCWHKPQRKWQAYILGSKARITLGYFRNEIDAAKAYDRAAPGVYGEFARLNLPLDNPLSACHDHSTPTEDNP